MYARVRVSEQNSTEHNSTVQNKVKKTEERLRSTYVLAEFPADGSDGLVECRGVHHHLTDRSSTEERPLSMNWSWSLSMSLGVSLNWND